MKFLIGDQNSTSKKENKLAYPVAQNIIPSTIILKHFLKSHNVKTKFEQIPPFLQPRKVFREKSKRKSRHNSEVEEQERLKTHNLSPRKNESTQNITPPWCMVSFSWGGWDTKGGRNDNGQKLGEKVEEQQPWKWCGGKKGSPPHAIWKKEKKTKKKKEKEPKC